MPAQVAETEESEPRAAATARGPRRRRKREERRRGLRRAELRTHVTLSERSDRPSSGIFCSPCISRENSWSHDAVPQLCSTARLKSASVSVSSTSTLSCPSGVCTRISIAAIPS